MINIPCKDGEDVEDMEVSGSEASEGLCPESTSNSDCGECCGGHAPHPTLSMSPRSPNIIPGRANRTEIDFALSFGAVIVKIICPKLAPRPSLLSYTIRKIINV